MFGNNNTKDAKTDSGRSSMPAGGGVNTIDVNTKIDGNLTAGGDIRIDGTLVGNLICKAKLIIGPKGFIEGDVECQKATIEGRFKGNLLVKDDLTLQATADVTGDVKAGKMAVLGGSKINGTCTVPYTGGSNSAKKSASAGDNPLKK